MLADSLRYLLLQVRNADDPMRDQEIACFARGFGCDASSIGRFDLLAAAPTPRDVASADVLLFGGSGDYSAAANSPWLSRTLDALREIHAVGKPTFASCWGFQALARALGGHCANDPSRAELGTIDVDLTEEGAADPVFGHLPPRFAAHAGHQDFVAELPPAAVSLARSDRAPYQAFTFPGKAIYCTQFHPELTRGDLAARLKQYPEYIERIAGAPVDEFIRDRCRETPAANGLLRRFVEHVFG